MGKTMRAVKFHMASVAFALACATLGANDEARSQTFPSRPVTMIVPYTPGGSADVVGRVIAQSMSRSLKEQVVIDNRGGAGGNVGAIIAARAAPDGHTLMLGTNTHAVNMTLYRKPGYDLLKDFAPVGQVSSVAFVLLLHPSLPATDVKSLIDLARKNPGEILYASSGNGSTPHLAAEMLKMATGIKMVHVPYKGAGDAMSDNVAGRVPVAFHSITSVLDFTRTKRLRPVGVTSAKRQPLLPDVPSFVELGYKDVEVTTWNALFVPAKTPAAIISRLNAETVKAVNDAEVRERFAASALEPISGTPQAMEAYVKEEVLRWGRVVKASGATVD
jgi:tripartite-type tricarboxylate transporter receptor subunit TctC